jgi:hypothetical protein
MQYWLPLNPTFQQGETAGLDWVGYNDINQERPKYETFREPKHLHLSHLNVFLPENYMYKPVFH